MHGDGQDRVKVGVIPGFERWLSMLGERANVLFHIVNVDCTITPFESLGTTLIANGGDFFSTAFACRVFFS